MKNKILSARQESYKKQIKELFRKIKEFDRIVIYRHGHPDYDAFGTQLGLAHFIKNNYPSKEVHCIGDDHVTLTGRCFPKMEVLEHSWFEKPFLAIVVDTSTFDRISTSDELLSYEKASYIVKIDHHPNVDPYGNLQIVDTSMGAAGELVANILLNSGKKVGKECAINLYKAICGDTGRFLYECTTIHTFEVAKLLIEKGFNITKVYSEMYDQKISDLETTAWILKNYQITEHGVAYYILTDETLKKLDLPPERGKENVNVFAHFEGINAWLSVTEDVKKGEWRVSIRSAAKSIEDVATKYHGGGHAQASGAKLKTFDELPALLKDLDNLFVE